MPNPADKDITEVLANIEDDIETYEIVNDPDDDDEEMRKMRRLETVIRRLAREAGYQLGE